tara:strand:- start:2104 stop:3042 length:939 start_codon:yes stop_codon:yes gene_type:complete
MYYQLKLRKFTNKNINKIDIDEDLIENLMKKNILECQYNTFPYIFDNNSKQSQKKYKSGNCVAMSINLQNMLKENGIKSYLIPATIPKMYASSDFLDISHVAVIIFKNENEAYVVDPAFYFLNPMKINVNNEKVNIIKWKNIYQGIEEDLKYKLHYSDEKHTYNEYQYIPKDTYSVETYENNDDKWMYFLIEVQNPDKAISSFNLTSNKYPFLAELDTNFNLKLYIKFIDKHNLIIKYNGDKIYTGHVDNIPDEIIQLIHEDMINMLGNNYNTFLRLPDNVDDKIYNLDDGLIKKSIKKKKNVKFNKTVKRI